MRSTRALLILLAVLALGACVHVCRCVIDREGGEIEQQEPTISIDASALDALGGFGKAAIKAALSLL